MATAGSSLARDVSGYSWVIFSKGCMEATAWSSLARDVWWLQLGHL